jgi:hypothetical protein
MVANFIPRIGAVFLLLAAVGCMSQPEELKAKADTNSEFGSPIAPPNSNTVLIPFAIDSQSYGLSVGYISTGASSERYGSVSGSGDFFDIWQTHWNNVVFYDKKTLETHLLLDRNALISRFIAPHNQDDKKNLPPQYFLFAIADTDTNGDGAINENDALILYVSDVAGRTLTRVTPLMTHFEDVVTDPDDNALYVRIKIDAKGDHDFSGNDPTTILRVDPMHPVEGKPITADELRQRAFHIVVP